MRILIVDDEASIRKTTAIAVQTAGHEAVEASSGARALKLLETEGFDVCFLDVKLGAEDGLAVMDKMLLAARGLAVVMFTAFANIATAVEAMRRGAFDFIPETLHPGAGPPGAAEDRPDAFPRTAGAAAGIPAGRRVAGN